MAACNDTNCPDLNTVIGPLSTLVRKWLQLRLFHFLATQAWVYNLKGKCFALPVPRSLKCSLMKAKLYKLSRLQWGKQQTEKWKHVCQMGFLVNSVARLEPTGICLLERSGKTRGYTNTGRLYNWTQGDAVRRGLTLASKSPVFNSKLQAEVCCKTNPGQIILQNIYDVLLLWCQLGRVH